jgi:hypothetical protein
LKPLEGKKPAHFRFKVPAATSCFQSDQRGGDAEEGSLWPSGGGFTLY